MQRFGEVARFHFLCWAVFGADLLLIGVVSDEKITHVNITGFLSTKILPVPIHEDGALVIMVHDILVYLETLPP